MQIESQLEDRITGIVAFDEMSIDALKWMEAHGQHRRHQHIHNLVVHRPGIVYGLEVFIHPKDAGKLVIAPGIAIDSLGRVIINPKAEVFTLNEKGTWFIVAEYAEDFDPNYVESIGESETKYRVIEWAQLSRVKDLPKTPHIELARVERTRSDKAISAPLDPFDPSPDELNTLYRQVAFPYCAVDGMLGECSYVATGQKASWKPNRAGLVCLTRAAQAAGFHLSFGGPIPSRNLAQVHPIFLYMSGAGGFEMLEQAQIEAISVYLSQGGLLVIDAESPSCEFAAGASKLIAKLKASPSKIAKGDALLTSFNLLTAIPPGASEKGTLTLDEEAGVLYSTANFGSLWNGNVSAAAKSRESIRDALELGLNIVAYAANRRRQYELSELVK